MTCSSSMQLLRDEVIALNAAPHAVNHGARMQAELPRERGDARIRDTTVRDRLLVHVNVI
jgi:hypothetical protein